MPDHFSPAPRVPCRAEAGTFVAIGTALIVHGHFYQPPRENPWTDELAPEPSAAPFHDWNERITAESYRPNAYARILDGWGRVVAIVNNYEHLSFDVGPTLHRWLDAHAPDVSARILAGDAAGRGATAQAYFHVILPLADARDVRTQVRWGLADFRRRFGHEAEGLWLPETAVSDEVLAVLAEEGVRFTILAPRQAARVRRLGDGAWRDVDEETLDTRVAYRWRHPERDDLGVDVVFFDGPLSHDLAFESPPSQVLVDRVLHAGDGLVCVATDGETFGHHHHYADRAIAYALAVEAPRRHVTVTTPAEYLRAHPPIHEVEVRVSAWSCAHGVGRWYEDCGCSTGGHPGWNQEWRAPLRAALDLLRDAAVEVFERRGERVLRDPWAARDAYVDVLAGARTPDDFAAEHVTGDAVEALTLLEAQRHAMAMYTSCGWFFADLAGLETVLVLCHAARVLDLLEEVGEQPPRDAFLDVLATAQSNDPAAGDGRAVWTRRVEPSRVTPERVVAHLALTELLGRVLPERQLAAFDLEWADHGHLDRGSLALCSGSVTLRDRRTGRRHRHVYAALHLGGLEVLGATRPADPERDGRLLAQVRDDFRAGVSVARLLRNIPEWFGPHEFDLGWALPGAAEQIVESTARDLAGRFVGAYRRLFEDHEPVLRALAHAGYPLPAELRAPAEFALARAFEAEVARHEGSGDPGDYETAVAIARQAREGGFRIDTPEAARTLSRTITAAVERAVTDPQSDALDQALALLRLVRDLGIGVNLEPAQELAYAAINNGGGPALRLLGADLGLDVDGLDQPS